MAASERARIVSSGAVVRVPAPTSEIFDRRCFMKTAMVFMAGAMFLSTAFGSDSGSEERFRMKTGRYTPAEEARREAAKIAAKGAVARQGISCAKHGCCANHEEHAVVAKLEVTPGDPGAEERFRMKFGRSSPAEARRVAAAQRATNEPVLLASVNMCKGDCCKHRQ
jgi:hypothetical protein